MKLAEAFQSLLGKKNGDPHVYLSLFLDDHTVVASFWRPGLRGAVEPLATLHKKVESGLWEDRIVVIDELLGLLEEKTKLSDITTTILGLSAGFLTTTGEIEKSVRIEIKKMASKLELTIAGFVPLTNAIVYQLKTDEGVPPSVILLDINDRTIAVSLYKIGMLVGVRDIEKHEDVSGELESALKSFTEMEVLPARIILYGSNVELLEGVKAKLLHHPWTTKANFLHFPKIEILSIDTISHAISLAGASEIKSEISQGQESEGTVTAQAPHKQEELVKDDEEDAEILEAQADETTEEVLQAEEILREDFAVDSKSTEDANVVMVDAESLGFKKDADILEDEAQLEEKEKIRPNKTSIIQAMTAFVSNIKKPKKMHMGLGVGIFVVLCIVLLGFWFLPKVTVTVLTIPQAITASSVLTIDPGTTIVDTENNIVPGRSMEKSVSGEKTIAVVGKKNVGDPARGIVAIYNKSLTTKTFKKGTILSSGSLKFTIDSDVEVASASESVGSITFGKKDAAVTALAIGGQSNLPGGGEFIFTDVSANTAIARNENAFTGGTSREVTVISRSDVDNFVKELSTELTAQAQEELSTLVAGGEQLVEGTIKTKVTEKAFDKEIDEEAAQLQGKLTITVSGVTVRFNDIHSLLVSTGVLAIPDGYRRDENNSKVTLTNIQVKKDGKITANVQMEESVLPTIDAQSLPAALAGKTINDAGTYLRSIPGVGGMHVSPTWTRLPFNLHNISITMSAME